MKRIHASETLFLDNSRAPVFGVTGRRSLTFALSIALLSLITLSGCNMFKSEDVYDDIYYSANFIGAIGFDDFDGANTTVPGIELTGQWDLAYRYETDWVLPNCIPYITLTDTGDTTSDHLPVASGLDPAARVFRLELVNLIRGGADGGEFETAAGSWTVLGPGLGTAVAVRDTTSNLLFGNGCMKLSATTDKYLLYTTVAAPLVTFYADKNYTVFFRYKSLLDPVLLTIGVPQTLNKTTGEKAFARYSLSSISAAPVFNFAPLSSGSTFSDLYVDNFRVSRSTNMALRLKLTAAQTTPRLEVGTYSFSVWAYTDPAAFETGVPRYNIDSFVIKMAAAEGTGNLSTTSATYAQASGWRKYTATLEPGALTFDEGTTAPVLTLVLDFNNTRPGSVFLAQPELRFHPDGL